MSSSVVDDRILVTGASGQLGTAFGRVYPDAVFLGRPELDLTDRAAIRSLVRELEPSLVVNCAAYTAVDAAEDDVETADAVNAVAVGLLAELTREGSARFVTFSTDYVFDGRGSRPYVESDPTDPINAYGATKLRGENLALAANPDTLVVRTSWVISETHDNFASAILRRAMGGAVAVVDDQVGRPTIADDLARGTAEAILRGMTGVLHLANEGATTWYELARALVADAGLDAECVTPCSTSDFPTRARRPAYSVLGSERTEAPSLPPWRESTPRVATAQMDRLGSLG
ncbi:MAG: dTDP-4-dehydrorhamnose reductase [Deltaproteobacteria bacterium]|jgi:dTDP-4-dehydrorhamnose reductase|nr:dTDP-4-dehydrorhamnose reductase [Deltaproteobacteria bacterium]